MGNCLHQSRVHIRQSGNLKPNIYKFYGKWWAVWPDGRYEMCDAFGHLISGMRFALEAA